MGKKERIKKLEERVTALEADRPGQVFTATNAYDEEPEAVTPEPTLWWFDGQFWVADGEPREIDQDDVYTRRRGEDFPATRAICAWGDLLGPVQPLRPAKTFPATDTRPELVESGEVRPVRPGNGADNKDWYICPQRGRSMYNGARTWGPRALPILIPLSEARKRCGVEEAGTWDGVPSDTVPYDSLYKAAQARAEKAEARVKELEAEQRLTCEKVAAALTAKADAKAIALSKAPWLATAAAEMCGHTPQGYRRAARLVRELGEVEG